MQLKPGDIVKIICKNGLVENGSFVEQDDNHLVLKCIDDSVLIILSPYENIVAIKVKSQSEIVRKPHDVAITVPLQLEEETSNENLRLKKLSDLHKLRIEEERKRARELLTTKTPVLSLPSPEKFHGYPTKLGPATLPKHTQKKT
jgi:hypothetical protein